MRTLVRPQRAQVHTVFCSSVSQLLCHLCVRTRQISRGFTAATFSREMTLLAGHPAVKRREKDSPSNENCAQATGERSEHGSTGRIGRSSGSTSPRADPPKAPSASERRSGHLRASGACLMMLILIAGPRQINVVVLAEAVIGAGHRPYCYSVSSVPNVLRLSI